MRENLPHYIKVKNHLDGLITDVDHLPEVRTERTGRKGRPSPT